MFWKKKAPPILIDPGYVDEADIAVPDFLKNQDVGDNPKPAPDIPMSERPVDEISDDPDFAIPDFREVQNRVVPAIEKKVATAIGRDVL